MNLAKKLVSVAAGVALVAGVGLAGSAPATAKVNTKKSATIISFKKGLVDALAAQGIVITAKAPATYDPKKRQIRFPVTKVTDDAISHSGGLVFTKGATVIEATNPTIITPTPVPADGFPVVATTALGENTPLLNLKKPKPTTSCKVDGAHKKWIKKTTLRVQAFVHLTSDPNVIGALQGLLSPAFTADLGLGAGRVTIEDDVNSKKKPKCPKR